MHNKEKKCLLSILNVKCNPYKLLAIVTGFLWVTNFGYIRFSD